MADIDNMYADIKQRTHVGDEVVMESPPVDQVEPNHPKGPKEPKVHKYLRYVIDIKASDLHFKSGARVHVRHKGDLRPIKGSPLSPEEVERLWFEIMNDHQKKQLREKGASDFAYQLGDSDRFRVNIFRQRGTLSVAARRVNRNILNFDELYLPRSIYKVTEFHQGLVLLAGITG